MHLHNEENFPQAKLDSEINVRVFFNEHGNLYFLLQNKSVHMFLFNLNKNKKFLSDGKKDTGETPLLWDANNDLENND